MLKEEEATLPDSPESSPCSTMPPRAIENFITVPISEAEYLGDLLNHYYHTWRFEGDLLRYNKTSQPAVAFFNELFCLVEQCSTPPAAICISNVGTLDFQKPEPGVLADVMLHCFAAIGKSKVTEIDFSYFCIPEPAFIQMIECFSYQARTKTLELNAITFRFCEDDFSEKRFSALIKLIRVCNELETLTLDIPFSDRQIEELVRAIQKNRSIQLATIQNCPAKEAQLIQGILAERKAQNLLVEASPFERFVMSCQIAFADEKKRKLNELHKGRLLRNAQTHSERALRNMSHFIDNAQYTVLAYRVGSAARASKMVDAKDQIGEIAEEAIIFGGSLIQKGLGVDPTLLLKIPILNPERNSEFNAPTFCTLGTYIRKSRVEDTRKKEHETALLIERIHSRDSAFITNCVLWFAEIYEPTIHLLSRENDIRIFTQALTQKFLDALHKVAQAPHLLSHTPLIEYILKYVVSPLAQDEGLIKKLRQKTKNKKLNYLSRCGKPLSIGLWECIETKDIVFENQDKNPHALTFIEQDHPGKVVQTDQALTIVNPDTGALELAPGEQVIARRSKTSTGLLRRAIRYEVGMIDSTLAVFHPDGYAFYTSEMEKLVEALAAAKADAQAIASDLHSKFRTLDAQAISRLPLDLDQSELALKASSREHLPYKKVKSQTPPILSMPDDEDFSLDGSDETAPESEDIQAMQAQLKAMQAQLNRMKRK